MTNGCSSHLIEKVVFEFPEVKIIQLPTNTGMFGRSVGFANSKGQYILSLDDDTTIKPNTLECLRRIFQQKPKRVAIITPNAYNPFTKHYYSSLATGELIGFHGSSAFRKEIFEKIGYFDHDFFFTVWETDFAIRAVDAGYQIYFAKNIVINHYHREKRGSLRKKQIFLNARNKAWLNIKHFSLKFIPLLVLRDLVWIILLPHRRKSIKALYYGIGGYFLGYLNLIIPLRKRKVVSLKTQKMFIKHYLFDDLRNLTKKWA